MRVVRRFAKLYFQCSPKMVISEEIDFLRQLMTLKSSPSSDVHNEKLQLVVVALRVSREEGTRLR